MRPRRPRQRHRAPIHVGGHAVYGVYIAAGDGYRDDHTSGIATGNSSEGEYAVLDGTHFNNGCCFDYGNAETNNDDDGAGTMEAIYFGTRRPGASARATARGSWPTWRTACSPAQQST